MSQSAVNVQAGPGRVFVNCSVPTSGAPPNLVAHTNGVPIDGTEVGYTEGTVEIQYGAKKTEINPEQSLAPVDVFTVEEMAQVTFTALETTYQTILRAFDNVGTVSGSNPIQGGGSEAVDLFYFGGGTSILSPFQASVFVSMPQRRNPGKYFIFMMYSAYSKDPYKTAFTKSKTASYQMTFVGTAYLASTRTAGDTLGQFYREH